MQRNEQFHKCVIIEKKEQLDIILRNLFFHYSKQQLLWILTPPGLPSFATPLQAYVLCNVRATIILETTASLDPTTAQKNGKF